MVVHHSQVRLDNRLVSIAAVSIEFSTEFGAALDDKQDRIGIAAHTDFLDGVEVWREGVVFAGKELAGLDGSADGLPGDFRGAFQEAAQAKDYTVYVAAWAVVGKGWEDRANESWGGP